MIPSAIVAASITPDEIPFIPGIIIAIILWSLLVVLMWRSSAVDPYNEYTRLDRLDGLDSRTG